MGMRMKSRRWRSQVVLRVRKGWDWSGPGRQQKACPGPERTSVPSRAEECGTCMEALWDTEMGLWYLPCLVGARGWDSV